MLKLRKLTITLTVFTLALGTTMFFVPDEAWGSANPCRVRCLTNGLLAVCDWGPWDSDFYCCWTHPHIGCQSYECASGTPVITRFICL